MLLRFAVFAQSRAAAIFAKLLEVAMLANLGSATFCAITVSLAVLTAHGNYRAIHHGNYREPYV